MQVVELHTARNGSLEDEHPSTEGRTPERPRSSSSQTVVLTTVLIAVFAVGAHLRSHALRGGVSWDESDYSLAGAQGVWANWWGMAGVHGLRHFHGPLSMQVIGATTRAFGTSIRTIRFPGLLASSAACALAAAAAYDLAPGGVGRLVAAALAGLLLATSPASVGMTQTAKPHPFVELFMVVNLWLLCRYLRERSRATAGWFGVSLAGQFLTMEYGVIVLGLAAVATVLVAWRERWRVRDVCGDALVALIACVLVVLALWPEGLVRGCIILNLRYNVQLATIGHRRFFRGTPMQHLPKWAYLWWYSHRYPGLLVAALMALPLLGCWTWQTRSPDAIALTVFTAGTLLAIHGAHIMALEYSTFAVPPLVLGAVLAGSWARGACASRDRTRVAGAAGRIGLLLLAAFGVGGGLRHRLPVRPVNTPIARLSRRLAGAAAPGETVLATSLPVVRHLLWYDAGRSDLHVVPYLPVDDAGHLRALQPDAASPPTWAIIGDWVETARPASALLPFVEGHWTLVERDEGYGLYHR